MQANLILTLKQLNLSLERYGREKMKSIGLSPAQGMTLHYLFARKGQPVYAVELHMDTGISKSSVSATLKSLFNRTCSTSQ